MTRGMVRPPLGGPRFTGPAPSYKPTSVVQWLRSAHRELRLHRCHYHELRGRFDQSGVHERTKLEGLLLGSPTRSHLKSVRDTLAQWPEELELDSLAGRLHVFLARKQMTCLKDAKAAFQGLSRGAQALLPQAEELLRLLLVLPAISATVEQSFSALRRLKTWLRSTMSQRRLNSITVLHEHHARVKRECDRSKWPGISCQ